MLYALGRWGVFNLIALIDCSIGNIELCVNQMVFLCGILVSQTGVILTYLLCNRKSL
jgi:hypothetical protein